MAFTQLQLDALKEAYASGVLTIKHGDNLITYQSMAEMEKAIARIEKEINGVRGPQLATYRTERGFR